jgi:hypothetical protein
MTLLQTLHLQPSDADAADSTGDTESPIAGYDRLDARGVVGQLAQHSQSQLATIETYERAHKDRPQVLNKLRYLRGREPLPGYDTLDPEQISTAVDDADLDTAKRVREYERKFKRRAAVIEAVMRATEQTGPASIRERRDNKTPSSS